MPNKTYYDEDIAYMVANGPKKGGTIITVDRDMIPELNKRTWSVNSNNYVHANFNGKAVKLHHVIMGKPLNNLVIDHINRDPLDNRRSNLRIATASQNVQNMDINVWIEAWGERKVAQDWINDGRVVCNNESTIRTRIELGWNHEEALTTPSKHINRFKREEDEYILKEVSKNVKMKDIAQKLGRPEDIVSRRMRDNIGWDNVDCVEKYCSKCDVLKPRLEFYEVKKARLGVSSMCRQCTRDGVKEYHRSKQTF